MQFTLSLNIDMTELISKTKYYFYVENKSMNDSISLATNDYITQKLFKKKDKKLFKLMLLDIELKILERI